LAECKKGEHLEQHEKGEHLLGTAQGRRALHIAQGKSTCLAQLEKRALIWHITVKERTLT